MRRRWRLMLSAILGAAITLIFMNIATTTVLQVDNSYNGIFCNMVVSSPTPMDSRGYPLPTIRYVNGACGYTQETLWLNAAINWLAWVVVVFLVLELLALVSRKSLYSPSLAHLRPIVTAAVVVTLSIVAVNSLLRILRF